MQFEKLFKIELQPNSTNLTILVRIKCHKKWTHYQPTLRGLKLKPTPLAIYRGALQVFQNNQKKNNFHLKKKFRTKYRQKKKEFKKNLHIYELNNSGRFYCKNYIRIVQRVWYEMLSIKQINFSYHILKKKT